MAVDISDILLKVDKPGRYVGGEYNVPDMQKPSKVRFCMCFPDVYEVGMSNLGMSILYTALNADKDTVCERCYAPWMDFSEELKKRNLPLMSIETKTPIKDFDILGFSIQYELAYTNILYMLDLAKIPFYARDRDDSFPLLIAGGPCSINPAPYADFFDLISIGEGEETLVELSALVKKFKGDKKKIIEEAVKIDGMYAPSLKNKEVKKSIVKDLNTSAYPIKPLVPNLEIIHDRAVVELFRGCYAGCRFCQACFFYRPIRSRNAETAISYAESMLNASGMREVGLSSLSSGDYVHIKEVLLTLNEVAKQKNATLQLPSLRLDSFDKKLITMARKSSLTFAPEAGTQRLRNVINKNISEEDIEKSFKGAFSEGYTSVKLYFMIGLPTETDEDVLGIAKTVEKIRSIYFDICRNKSFHITVSTAIFIPKPLTPFQWEKQISIEEMSRKVGLLITEFKKMKGVHYNWHGADTSVLEAVFARGDNKLAPVIERAFQLGAKFDGWGELFNFEIWKQAFDDCGINMGDYTREFREDEVLPWDFVNAGVTKKYFLNERHKAYRAETTKGCKHGCNACGAATLGECEC